MNPNKPEIAVKITEPVTAVVEPVATKEVAPTPTTTSSKKVVEAAPATVTATEVVAPTSALAELKEKLSTLPDTTKSYLKLIDGAAKDMSNGANGIALDMAGVQRRQSVIFGSILNIINDTPDNFFNLAMYALALTFKENGESRVGGLSPERALQAINAMPSDKNPGVVNYQWIPGKTDDDISWYRSIVVSMHTAHSRGSRALKAAANVTESACSHRTMQLDKTKANRLRAWFDNCNPL